MALFSFRQSRQPYQAPDGTVMPHPHHYQFVYRGLPNFFFTDPKRAVTLFGAPERLPTLWRSFGDVLQENDRLTQVEPSLRDSDAERVGSSLAICIRMPDPVTNGEEFFVAAVLAQDFAMGDTSRDPQMRYFTLSRCSQSEGFLREVPHDCSASVAVTHRPVPAKIRAFVAAISEAIADEHK